MVTTGCSLDRYGRIGQQVVLARRSPTVGYPPVPAGPLSSQKNVQLVMATVVHAGDLVRSAA
jgi:hypothetical protein